MDHWFDRLTKALAEGKQSRRDMLGSTIKASVAAAAAPLVTRSEALAQMFSGEIASTQPASNTCQSRREGRARTFTLGASSTFGGQPLTYNQTVRQTGRKGSIEVNETIRLGRKTLFQMDVTRTGNSSRVRIRYGDGFQGIREGNFTSNDGQTIAGDVDGKRVVPFRAGADPRTIRFANPAGAPTLKITDETKNAIKSITDKAKENAASCSARRTTVAPSGAAVFGTGDASDRRPFSLKFGDHHAGDSYATGSILAQGDPGHDSYPEQSGACLACEGGCTATGIGCGVGTAVGCALTFGIGCAIGIASCAVAIPACFLACHASGAPCCPVTCGDVACCDKSEECLDVNRGVCCSKGLKPCSNKNCCKTTDTCINATGFCCPAGQTICNSVCCKKGEVCKNGVVCCPPEQETCGKLCCGPNEVCVGGKKCCPKENKCGDVCCDKLAKCADPNTSTCCSFAAPACGGTCCKPGQQCINGKCCSNPCGTACCSSSQACLDPKTSKCVSKKCAPGQVTCVSQESASKLGAALCCPPNVQCCLGKCCKKGELCCSGGGTLFGCHDPQLCVA